VTSAHEHERAAGPYSVEFLHWACGNYPSGRARLASAHGALGTEGQPPENQWPYDVSRDETLPTYVPPRSVVGPFVHGALRVRGSTIPALQAQLEAGRWPVLVLRVTNALLSAVGGIVGPDGPGVHKHAVLAVGVAQYTGVSAMGPVQPQERLLCVRNSWGTSWGTDGYALVTETALDQCRVGALILQAR
jgi:hypothetical protein